MLCGLMRGPQVRARGQHRRTELGDQSRPLPPTIPRWGRWRGHGGGHHRRYVEWAVKMYCPRPPRSGKFLPIATPTQSRNSYRTKHEIFELSYVELSFDVVKTLK